MKSKVIKLEIQLHNDNNDNNDDDDYNDDDYDDDEYDDNNNIHNNNVNWARLTESQSRSSAGQQ